MASHEITYTLRDRLGSVVTLTNHNNLIMEHRSFDPFGKPRYGTMQASPSATLWNVAGGTPFTMRGFTDHEHIDEAQLIHMNGRVYDYNLGRFLSVDPFIQEPGNSQSLNPYSYIMNNPLAGTDPSGYVSVGNLGLAEGGAFCGFICAVNRTILAGFTSAGDNGIGAMSKRAFGQQIAELGGQKDFAGYTWLQDYKRNTSKQVSGGTGEAAEFVDNFIDNHVNHITEALMAADDVSSPVTTEVRFALIEMAKTETGRGLMEHFIETGTTLALIDTTFTRTSENLTLGKAFMATYGLDDLIPDTVFYTRDIQGFTSVMRVNNPFMLDSVIQSMTLDVLLVQEFGHTRAGGRFGIDENNTYNEVVSHSLVENKYRAEKGLPLRRSYSKKDDIYNYMNKIN